MKKILVCGVTGFIGRNVAEKLAENPSYQVYGVYHKKAPFTHPKIIMLSADLTRKEDVERVVEDKDVIIQMAATTSGAKDILSKPFTHVTDNVVMSSLIFRAAYEKGVKHIVFPSCTIMYSSSDTPLKETDFDANREINKNYFGAGWTKVYLEKMAEFFSRLGTTKYTVFRHSNVYGPHDKYDLEKSHVFGATITKVMTAQDKVTVWGTGEEERDLLYVSDLVDAIILSLEKQTTSFELMNIGYGSSIAVHALVKKIVSESGKPLTIEYDSTKPTIKTKLCLDCTKAKILLGWQPKYSLDEGIRKTFEWYRANHPLF